MCYTELRGKGKQKKSFQPTEKGVSMMTGKILWYRERDGFGIIVDLSGNEYYFDKSVVSQFSELNKQDNVSFTSVRVQGLLVARNVSKQEESV